MPRKRHKTKYIGLAAYNNKQSEDREAKLAAYNKRQSEDREARERVQKHQRVQEVLKQRIQKNENLSSLGAVLLIQAIQFRMLIQHFYCTHCHKPLSVNSSTSSIHFTLHLKCVDCNWIYDWENTTYTPRNKSRLPVQFWTAATVVGLHYQRMVDFCSLLGIGLLHRMSFWRHTELMKRIVITKAKKNMNSHLQQAKGHFSFDFRWAKRRQASLGTGTLIDVNTKKIVQTCNPTKQHAGTAQGMEPFATTVIFRQLAKANIPVLALVHDKCMSAMP